MSTVLAFIPAPPTNGFHLGPLVVHLYGLLHAVGILLAVSLARRRWAERGRDPAELDRPSWTGRCCGRSPPATSAPAPPTSRPTPASSAAAGLHVVAIWEGGLALYGGLTVGILVGTWVAHRRGLPVLEALDAAIPGIPLAQALGRLGNYFNQELFGTPSGLPWALRVDPGHRPDRYLGFSTFHPTFLYESLYDLLVVGALLWLDRRHRLRTGSIALAYLGLYAFGRFFLELLRTDTTYRLLGLSRNGWVSLGVMLGAGGWLWLRERHRRPRQPPPPATRSPPGRPVARSTPAPRPILGPIAVDRRRPDRQHHTGTTTRM